MDEKLLKPYNPQETESRIYQSWEESGFFNPNNLPGERPEVFSIVLPPPNVTGNLHIGHAAMLAIEDIMVRYNRMKGKKTLWLPGTDHAAIATQSRVEKELYKKEKKTRHDLGREKFLKLVEEFAQKSHDNIVRQIKAMGASVDWSREAYTLDEKRSLAVKTAFKEMYDRGLIYRGDRIVNWCPRCHSTLADDEVEYKEEKTILYTFKYDKNFPIAVATTRPETKLGDTGVAVHPEDKRYSQYIGQTFKVRLGDVEREIKIVADEAIDPEFGTGAVGITPAHSFIDYEISKRHKLPLIKIIDERGRMTKEAGKAYEGLKVKEAREKFVQYLKENGLMAKEEEITHNLSTCYRCGHNIEPLPSLQWFIDVNKEFTIEHSKIKGIKAGAKTTLKELMRKPVESGQIKIIPERFEKIYFHWIDNLRDWCISRQIWFGHRIPVFYCQKDRKKFIVSIEAPKKCPLCRECQMEQDPDTLDTWFSSGLWTFSTLGWPEETEDLKTYHPTSVLETGYDILFFWVARMILMSTFLLGEVPFYNVYLHGLVRDERGRKMSKSLGNVIDPLDMTEKYGADAVRMALIIGTSPGNDMKISENKIKGYKHFANKLWNITRFILANTENINHTNIPPLQEKDKEYLGELEKLAEETTAKLEEFKFYLAGENLYHYAWHRLADEIIEESKPIFREGSEAEKASRQWTLLEILKTIILLLHPFMPFVTEEIWSFLPLEKKSLLIVEKWPYLK